MKQELRCHAVLCPSENKARMMAKRLKERLHQALVDFKKEKVWKQNARLSLANAADEQKTMPFRKIMLQAGSSNYRPPLEKGKSAPKLKVIEEVIFEEDEEDQDMEQDPDDHRQTYQITVSNNRNYLEYWTKTLIWLNSSSKKPEKIVLPKPKLEILKQKSSMIYVRTL